MNIVPGFPAKVIANCPRDILRDKVIDVLKIEPKHVFPDNTVADAAWIRLPFEAPTNLGTQSPKGWVRADWLMPLEMQQ